MGGHQISNFVSDILLMILKTFILATLAYGSTERAYNELSEIHSIGLHVIRKDLFIWHTNIRDKFEKIITLYKKLVPKLSSKQCLGVPQYRLTFSETLSCPIQAIGGLLNVGNQWLEAYITDTSDQCSRILRQKKAGFKRLTDRMIKRAYPMVQRTDKVVEKTDCINYSNWPNQTKSYLRGQALDVHGKEVPNWSKTMYNSLLTAQSACVNLGNGCGGVTSDYNSVLDKTTFSIRNKAKFMDSETDKISYIKPAVPCIPSWANWDRGECSTTCGNGTQTLTRNCINGPGCEGDDDGGDTKTIACDIVQCEAAFIDSMVDNSVIFYLQSIEFGTYLYTKVDGKNAVCVEEQSDTAKLILFRNPSGGEDGPDGYTISSFEHATDLRARNSEMTVPLTWTSASSNNNRWQFIPVLELDGQWAIKSHFDTYLQSSNAIVDWRWGPPKSDLTCGAQHVETTNDCDNMCCDRTNCGVDDGHCKCDGCVDFRSVPGKTRMSWSIQKDCSDCDGNFAFEIKDVDKNVLGSQAQTWVTGSGYIDVDGEVDTITFTTDSHDGTNLLIQVTGPKGNPQQYICNDCLNRQYLTKLYIDTDMNGKRDGEAYCKNKCTFQKQLPMRGDTNVYVLPTFVGAMSWRIVPIRTIKTMYYHVDDALINLLEPVVVGHNTVYNDCVDTDNAACPLQTSSVVIKQSESSTKSHSYTNGVKITAGTTFTVGVPFISDVKVSISAEASHTHTWGETETTAKEWTTSASCYASSGMQTLCEFVVKKTQIDLPFTVVWNTGELTHGIYHNLDYLDLQLTTTSKAIVVDPQY